jgi:iron complex transport system substrate-binding protein
VIGRGAAFLTAGLLAAAAAPVRIVSVAPSTTEILFAVGAGPRVVADTRFCDYPPAARALPKVGGFLDVSYEAVLAARPDLVVGARNAANRDVVDRLAAAGVPTEFPPAETVAETLSAVRAIGARTGDAGRAEAVAVEMERALARLSGLLAGAPPVRVLVLYGHRPLVVAGGGTFADELLRRARAVNLAGGSAVRYPTWPPEAVAEQHPGVIVDVSMAGTEGLDAGDPSAAGARGEAGGAGGELAALFALRDTRLVRLDAVEVMRPGPRLARALVLVAHAVHPALVPAP